jgi:hypothetical protein
VFLGDDTPKKIQIFARSSGTRMESKELEAESMEEPWEILFLPILRFFLG